MGGAQPLTSVLAGAAILVVEADPRRVERRPRKGYVQRSRLVRHAGRRGR